MVEELHEIYGYIHSSHLECKQTQTTGHHRCQEALIVWVVVPLIPQNGIHNLLKHVFLRTCVSIVCCKVAIVEIKMGL